MRTVHTVFTGVILASCAGWFGAAGTPEPTTAPKVHKDGKAMGRAALDVVAALLREDAAGAAAAVERLERACRRIYPEEEETFGDSAHTIDRAMHRVFQTTREFLAAGKIDRAFDEFVWAQRTCRQCHAVARQRGLLPATGPLWEESVTSTKRVETTQFAEKPR